MRMSPEQRDAERESHRQEFLARLSPEARQSERSRRDRFDALSPAERRAHMAARRLAREARLLKSASDAGVPLVAIMATLEAGDSDAVTWLGSQLSSEPTPSEPRN